MRNQQVEESIQISTPKTNVSPATTTKRSPLAQRWTAAIVINGNTPAANVTEAIHNSQSFHGHQAALVANSSSRNGSGSKMLAGKANALGIEEAAQNVSEIMENGQEQQQQQQLQQQNLININQNSHDFSLNNNNPNNRSNINNNNNNKNTTVMSASVNNVLDTSNILHNNSSNNSNNSMELALSKNNTNMQSNCNNNNNTNNHNQNKACNNNKSAVNAAPMAPTITTATTTIATATTVTTANTSSNKNNNNKESGSAGGKGSPTVALVGATLANAALTASHNPSTNTNPTNNINTISANNNNNNNNTSTSNLLRKQFIASSDGSNTSFSSASVAGSIQDDMSDQCSLTQAGLEEYNIRASSYYDQPAMLFHHQKQSSYAQSEGYHSYVSSSDSSSATPFLDRLRQESEMLSRQSSHHWSQNDLSSVSCASMAPSPTPLLLSALGRDLAVTGVSSTDKQQQNNSSESTSSTETLKWLGSMSDVSEASHATGYSAISESVSSSQLIVHSSRVLTPKRHHSESVLYLHNEHQQQQQLQQHQQSQSLPSTSATPQQNSPGALLPAAKQISPTLSARECTHSPTRSAALLPNHRHSPSYPPMHATAAMHPYQPHPQYALRSQPQSLAHKLIAATPKTDIPLNSSSSATADNSLNRTKASPPLPVLTTTQPSSEQSSLAQTKSLSISVTTTQLGDESPTSSASHSPAAIASEGASASRNASHIIVEVSAVDGKSNVTHSPDSSSHSPGSANSQLNASSTSLASAVSAGSAHSYRGNHRLFPVSTYTEKVHSNTSQFVLHPKPQYSAGLQKPTKQQEPEPQSAGQNQTLQQTLSVAPVTKYMISTSSPPQPSWQSVAELINDFERTKNEPPSQKYTYMDPGKTHRVSNPALKAFQKNAVQSYFERQQQQQHQHAKEQGQTQNVYHPISAHSQQHSPPPQQQQRQQQLPKQQPQQQQKKHSPTQPSHQQLLRPHSYSSNLKESAVQHQIMRNSLPNSYGSPHSHLSVNACPQQHQQVASVLHQQHLQTRLCSPPPPLPPQKLNSSSSSHSALDECASFTSTGAPLSVTVTMSQSFSQLSTKPLSPAPPPPPPRSRSLMPHTLLRRSSSASDYAEFRDQYTRATQEKLLAQSVKNISNSEKSSFNDCGMPPPPPPPRGARPTNVLTTRRTSSATEYAAAMREKALLQQAAALAHQQHHPHQHARPPICVPQYYNPPPPLPAVAAAIEPGWVPERPPKNPNLRVPSPDLPPLPPSADLDAQLADEPLPPPPPELLQQQRQQYQQQQMQSYFDLNSSMHASVELLPKAPSPNRRNSFAGSSTRKSYFGRTNSEMSTPQSNASVNAKMPPLIPKKPTNIDAQHAVRHTQQQHAQLQHAQQQRQQAQQQHQQEQQLASKLLLNGNMPQPQQHSPPSPPTPQALSNLTSASNGKLSANRKRAHNPVVSGFGVPPPIMENVQIQQQHSPQQLQCGSKSPSNTKSSPPPPPLLPRCMPHQTLVSNNNSSSQATRCNSKASYLPRHSLEKLNTLDPDHGSYKLTLTSNEDLVANTKPTPHDILNTHSGKLPANNLPDVLPLGAKLQSQPQPSSPTSANSSPLRYGSNNNFNSSTMSAPSQQQQHQQQQPTTPNSYPAYPPTQHRYSTPALNAYNSNMTSGSNKSAGKAANYSRSQSYDVHNSSPHNSNLHHSPNHAHNSPTKFMSQSTLDLKRTQLLEPTLEETTAALLSESANALSPAQSESSLSSPSRHQQHQHHMTTMMPLSSLGSSSDSGSCSTAGSEGRIFRAELVTATLATSPITPTKSVIRKDSLRENIEKITQLQSKLMSAHLSESSLIGSMYGSKTALNSILATPTTAQPATTENVLPQSDESSLKQTSDFSVKAESKNQVCADLSDTPTSATDGNAVMHVSGISDTNSPHTPEALTLCATLPQPVTTVASANTTTEDLIDTQVTQLNPNTDGLQLMQRSEIILRVNPTTTEAASQTGDDLISAANDTDEHTRLTEQAHNKEEAQQQRITLQPRQRQPIEIDCEEMSLELATLLASNEKLVHILAPPTLKSPTDYVSNLYNPNVPLRPAKRDVGTSTLLRMKGRVDAQEKVMVELQYAEVEVLLTNGESEAESSDLLKKKVDELIKQLYRKISILNKEQITLKEEAQLNDDLGNSIINKLTNKVRPIEATKCRTYIDDVGQITSLLLSLSERLARIENSLSTVTEKNGAERKSLELKRDRLLDQLAEAKRLKEDIERRGSSVFGIVEKNLSGDEYADFDYFINMKAKLIADTRDIADKIKCGEEQLHALSEALVQSDC